jgi:Icc-related predicted phosphoesterase
MRVLALADRPPPVDPAAMARQAGVDAIVCLGDLDRGWIESIASVAVPRVGVHGNHDPPGLLRQLGVEDLHLRRRTLDGMTFCGFEGCVRYGPGRHPHQYTQRQARRLVRKLPEADVLVCHCPPFGINDEPSDPAHVGWEALREWVDEHQPRHLLHGHTHPQPGRMVTRHGPTAVHFVSGARILTLT